MYETKAFHILRILIQKNLYSLKDMIMEDNLIPNTINHWLLYYGTNLQLEYGLLFPSNVFELHNHQTMEVFQILIQLYHFIIPEYFPNDISHLNNRLNRVIKIEITKLSYN